MQPDYVHHDASTRNRQGPDGPGDGQDQGGVTFIPNWLFDELLGRTTPSEWAALFFIVTRGGGGEGPCATLSYRDFLAGCGIKSSATLRKALAALEAMGIITCWRHGALPTTYRVATYEEYHHDG